MANTLGTFTGGDGIDNLLDILCDCGKGDTENFRRSLNESGQELFDRLDEPGQLIVTALNKLDAQTIEMIRESTRDQYMVVFHDLSNHLMKLEMCKTI
jgi:hypothetical protein